MFVFHYKSPIGYLRICSNTSAITEISFIDQGFQHEISSPTIPDVIKQCAREFDQYFEGTLKKFETPVFLEGTDFQIRVWNELSKIPYGTTITYTEQSKRLGDVKAVRAVGTCNGQNPIAIIVPCHRVIAVDGSLTGYAGGIEKKKWLLLHEQEHSDANDRGLLF